jgi:hypothetical protein
VRARIDPQTDPLSDESFILVASGHMEDLAPYDARIAQNPDEGSAYLWRGKCHMRNGSWAAAKDDFQKALTPRLLELLALPQGKAHRARTHRPADHSLRRTVRLLTNCLALHGLGLICTSPATRTVVRLRCRSMARLSRSPS